MTKLVAYYVRINGVVKTRTTTWNAPAFLN